MDTDPRRPLGVIAFRAMSGAAVGRRLGRWHDDAVVGRWWKRSAGPWLALTLALAACDGAPTLMVVELHTNLLPGVDFERARLTLRQVGVPGAAELVREHAFSAADRDETLALRLAELPDMPEGLYVVHVDLVSAAGGFVADRTQTSPFRGAQVIPVIISRDCAGVRCADGLTCYGGGCVDPRCLPGADRGDAVCPDALCGADADCDAPVACARPRCLGGACFPEPDDDRCPSGQACHVERGCVPVATGARDAGVPLCTEREACDGADDDCDGLVDEGYDLASDPSNCGFCGARCGGAPGADPTCAGGTCGFACRAGRADCNGSAADGCEADLASTASCGACGVRCAGATPACDASTDPARCASGCGALASCGGTCVDTQTSPTNCGACGVTCDAGESCVGGACRCGAGPACAGATTCCSGACVDTGSSLGHCGACGRACVRPNATPTCAAGVCRIGTCDAGWANCDGMGANGCEADVANDPARCGTCTTSCGPYANATAGCALGACTVASCDGVWRDCNGSVDDGCETRVWDNDAHCGGCGVACTGGLRCNTNLCCAPRTLNCDGAPGNGCECAYPNAFAGCASMACALGPCVAGFGDCNGAADDGCEETLSTSTAHCGACGSDCAAMFPTPWMGARYDRCTAGSCACGGGGACPTNNLCCPIGGATSACRSGIDRNTDHCGRCGAVCDEAGGETCGRGTPPTGGTAGRCCCGTNCGAVGAGRFCPAGTECNETTGACVATG